MERIITSNTVETASQESSSRMNLIWKCTEKKANHPWDSSDTNSPRAKPASPTALTTKTHLLKVFPNQSKLL